MTLSFGAIRVGGKVSIIGGLSGGARELNPGLIFSKRANVQGISVGSMQTFETMNAAIAANKIKPVIDRVVGFDEVQAAYQHMAAGAHFGKNRHSRGLIETPRQFAEKPRQSERVVIQSSPDSAGGL